MGIDLYAGPLARYYSGEWQTQAAIWAQESDVEFETIYQGSAPVRLDQKESADAVQAFRMRIEPKLGALPSWSKASDPYKTYQLRAEGFGAVVLAAALRHRPELKRPKTLPKSVYDHPAVAEASARGYYVGPMAAFEAQIIVPGEDPRICADVDCRGNEVIVVTLPVLQQAIEAVSEFLELSSNQLDDALSEGVPDAGSRSATVAKRRWIFSKTEVVEDELVLWARWGLACYRASARLAEETGAAIIRDE